MRDCRSVTRRALLGAAATTALAGSALAQPQGQTPPVQADPRWRKYNGNPAWRPDQVYTRDEDLGTPSNVGDPRFGPWHEMGGRRIRLVSRTNDKTHNTRFQGHTIWGINAQMGGHEPDCTFEGLEDVRGRVILPTVYREVRIVPGRGIFIMSHIGEQTYQRYDPQTGAKTPVIDLAEIRESEPNSTLPWRTAVFTMLPDPALSAEERAKPWRQQERPGRLEIISLSGTCESQIDGLIPYADRSGAASKYGRRQVEPDSQPFIVTPVYIVDGWRGEKGSRVGWVDDNGVGTWQLLKPDLYPLTNALPVEPRTMSSLTHWVLPAPIDGLWFWQDDEGQWHIPDGALGYQVFAGKWAIVRPGPEAEPMSRRVRFLDDDGKVEPEEYRDVRVFTAPTHLYDRGSVSSRPTLALQRLDGRWATAYIAHTYGMPADYRDIQQIGDVASVSTLADAERLILNVALENRLWSERNQAEAARVARERAEREYARQQQEYDAWRQRQARYQQTTLGSMGEARGDAVSVTDPNAWAQSLRSQTEALVNDPYFPGIIRLELIAQNSQVSDELKRWATSRIEQIRSSSQQSSASSRGVSAGGASSSSGDAWSAYRQQSTDHQRTMQAMRDYTYGRSTQNPYDAWLR